MAKLIECLNSLFGTTDLYEALQVSNDASDSEIKKGYFKVSLQVHPDRVAKDERAEATRKFQSVSQVYKILSNADKRQLYDESGEIDDEYDTLNQNKNWDSYWRILFKKVTITDIDEFTKEYRNSEKEKEDVKTVYEECKGDMDGMLEKIPCSTVEDDLRFKEIIDEKINQGEVQVFDAFRKENGKTRSRRRKLAKWEAKEAAKAEKEIGFCNNQDDLKAMILKQNENRQKEMDSFFANLSSKYGNPVKKRKLSKDIKDNKGKR